MNHHKDILICDILFYTQTFYDVLIKVDLFLQKFNSVKIQINIFRYSVNM